MQGQLLKNIVRVCLSNIVAILSGIVVGFLVPKMLTVEGYGLYKTFTLYCTYAGLCSLGIIDGIVLKYGGVNYDKLDKKMFRSTFLWYMILHGAIAALLIIIAVFSNDHNVSFILALIGINIVSLNVTGYYQQISQITQRFKEFSYRKIIQSGLSVFSTLLLYCAYLKNGNIGYKYYVLAVVCINVALTIWYIFTYRDISFGEGIGLSQSRFHILDDIKNGLPLLFSNMCGTLLLTLDRQFVNVLFDTRTYAVYAFAYNMLALVTVATSAIGTVLYPTLKRTKKENLSNIYMPMVCILQVFVFFALVAYFPLCIIINRFLPNYIGSLPIFRIIFPGLALSSVVTVVMHNYYKVIGENLNYFKKIVVTLLFSAIANAMAYWLFRSTAAISVASIVTMYLWYLYTENYIRKNILKMSNTNMIYLTLMMGIFYMATSMNNYILSGIIYFGTYIVITIMFYHNTIVNDFRLFIRK